MGVGGRFLSAGEENRNVQPFRNVQKSAIDMRIRQKMQLNVYNSFTRISFLYFAFGRYCPAKKENRLMGTLLNITVDESGQIAVESDMLQVQTKEGMALLTPISKNDTGQSYRPPQYNDIHPELTKMLTLWRRNKAREENVSAYIILTNKVLHEISDRAPSTIEDLREIKGFGPVLSSKYGREILEIVNGYEEYLVNEEL